ncbi:MAG: ADP-ribosylation factor-like protein, partial [Candidatus Heimdallarchaeota archaeon]
YSHLLYLIFVVDSSLPELFEKAQFYFERASNNALEFSKNVKILIFAHKFDLIQKEEESNVVEKIKEEFKSSKKFNAEIFNTSIFDDSIVQVLEELYVESLLPETSFSLLLVSHKYAY